MRGLLQWLGIVKSHAEIDAEAAEQIQRDEKKALFEKQLLEVTDAVAKNFFGANSDYAMARHIQSAVAVEFFRRGYGDISWSDLRVTIDGPGDQGDGSFKYTIHYTGSFPVAPVPPEAMRKSWIRPDVNAVED